MSPKKLLSITSYYHLLFIRNVEAIFCHSFPLFYCHSTIKYGEAAFGEWTLTFHPSRCPSPPTETVEGEEQMGEKSEEALGGSEEALGGSEEPPASGPSAVVVFGRLVQKHSYVSALIIMMVTWDSLNFKRFVWQTWQPWLQHGAVKLYNMI